MDFPASFLFFKIATSGDFPATSTLIPTAFQNVSTITVYYRDTSPVYPIKYRPKIETQPERGQDSVPSVNIFYEPVPIEEYPAYIGWKQIGECHSFAILETSVLFHRFIKHIAYEITFDSAEALANFIGLYGSVSFNVANTYNWFRSDRKTPITKTISVYSK